MNTEPINESGYAQDLLDQELQNASQSFRFLISTIIFLTLILFVAGFIYYQVFHRPLPNFEAINPTGERMVLTPYEEPNLLSDTIIQWAKKAAVLAYTYDFGRYQQQLNALKPYFTEQGYADYKSTVQQLINDVIKKQLIVNGVVSGIPVISNQGPLPDVDYAWVVQIPFLVTYQTGSMITQRSFMVIITIVRVPTTKDPRGISIKDFVMR